MGNFGPRVRVGLPVEVTTVAVTSSGRRAVTDVTAPVDRDSLISPA